MVHFLAPVFVAGQSINAIELMSPHEFQKGKDAKLVPNPDDRGVTFDHARGIAIVHRTVGRYRFETEVPLTQLVAMYGVDLDAKAKAA